jgi:hypothetical protein
MQKIILPFLFTLLPLVSFAQAAEKELEKGIESYNAFDEYLRGFATPDDMDANALENGKERCAKGIAFLDKAIGSGNADEIRAARYFKTNFRYKRAFMLGFKGDRQAAYNELKAINSEMESYGIAQFPISYYYYGKTYTIRYDNFAPQLAEYYSSYAEMILEVTKDKVSAHEYAKKAHTSSYAAPWVKYTSCAAAAKYEAENDPSLNLYPATLLSQLETYVTLEPRLQAIVQKENLSTANDLGKKLLSLGKTNPNYPNMTKISGNAAAILAKITPRDHELVFDLFMLAKNDPGSTENFMVFARDLAKNYSWSSELWKMSATQATNILDQRRANASKTTDCQSLLDMANDYELFKRAATATELRELARNCQRTKRKTDPNGFNRFNLYVGVFPIPLLSAGDRRDLGGHVDFCFYRTALSFGYVKLQHKRDWNTIFSANDQKYYWDGERYRFAIKQFKKGRFAYSGIMFGYARKRHYTDDKQRESITAAVEQGSNLFNAQFRPLEEQYELLLISGGQALGRLFGSDICFGLGLSGNRFEGGSEYWKQNGSIIRDNKLLSKRSKFAVFPQIYLNWSLGLNLGKPR